MDEIEFNHPPQTIVNSSQTSQLKSHKISSNVISLVALSIGHVPLLGIIINFIINYL